MGVLIDGKWHDQWYDTAASGGRFIRSESQYRHWITRDGSPGPSGDGGFKAEPGRYHLYVSWACPWAHRTLIMRVLKGLEDMISLSSVHWLMREDGWTFKPGPGVIPDPLNHADFLHQVYTAADPHYSGHVTVPLLWDKQRRTIVNNESAEIIRMLTSAFDAVGAKAGDYYPEALHAEIDAVNLRVYDNLNNGVYKAGFATSQAAYEEAAAGVFDTLDWLEQRLSRQRYLVGNQPTEADIRLFTTLMRFDEVYQCHFKCNRRRIVDYPNLWGFTREIFQLPGIAATVN
ncbi:MAG TPA: glutathione S-transferase family protein, partial [Hyphomicrobiales bacterium]|nr:glutathione S-transferase family protein [Hyphomicrobiales bacterium]